MEITSTSTKPFERLALDIVGTLPESGIQKFKYILTLQDDLTKFSSAYPMITSTTEEIADCNDILNPVKVLLRSNAIKFQSLSHIVSTNSSIRINKWSLEFGGEILKFFFGTLDADDARKYDAAISTCQQDETQILNLMKDNIHVVQSSINAFNSSIYKLNDNEEKLNHQINLMNSMFSNYSNYNNALENVFRLNSYINIIESSLLTLSNILDSILNSILFSKINILHPSVISPMNLLTELEKHSDICDIFNDSVHLLSPISLTNINLESLRHASHKLDNLEKEINKIQDQPHIIKYGSYYSTFTYILI
ncbi:uncharacterized protein LOC131846088, partial [Achroia grisella]|uniref:uncharacterized protein LOC131846088 n=1 Tax=Achroia grisella TaxID=688607 RepID=UPI0027D272EC